MNDDFDDQLRRTSMVITPYLYYEDLTAALNWLAKAFGFKRYGAQMKGPDGKLNHAAMKLGEGVVMMGRPDPKQDRKSTRLNSSHPSISRMPSSA